MFYLPEDEHGGVPIGGGWQDTPASYAPLVVADVMVAFGVQRRRFGGSYQTWNMGQGAGLRAGGGVDEHLAA